VNTDVDGRTYEDHYFPVVENETRSDWGSLVVRVKRAFLEYPVKLKWTESRYLSRIPSPATQGNLLEAINITLNVLQFHYMDRDFARTGNSIVVVSPGCGVFEVRRSGWRSG
jgi:hypothetical protein